MTSVLARTSPRAPAGSATIFDVGQVGPATQAGLRDPKVLGNLFDHCIALAGNRDDIVAELSWMGFRQDKHCFQQDRLAPLVTCHLFM